MLPSNTVQKGCLILVQMYVLGGGSLQGVATTIYLRIWIMNTIVMI